MPSSASLLVEEGEREGLKISVSAHSNSNMLAEVITRTAAKLFTRKTRSPSRALAFSQGLRNDPSPPNETYDVCPQLQRGQ